LELNTFLGVIMEIFITLVVLGVVVVAVKYYLDSKKSKVSEEPAAPYKVEAPVVEPVAVAPAVEQVVVPVAETVVVPVAEPTSWPAAPAPELKVVTGDKKAPVKRSTAPKAKNPAKPAAPKPRAPKKPKVTK
jgi:hypothetical protein